MNRNWKIGIAISFIVLAIIIFRLFFMRYYYDFSEYWNLKDRIVWTENKKLKYSDFKFTTDPELKGLYVKLGLHSRFNVNDPILFRSHAVFEPETSTISDTTDFMDLRTAQAKFDLLEIYRRRMEKEVDSLRKLSLKNLKPSDFEKMNEQYYFDFKKEWEKHINSNNEVQSLERLEKKINSELK